MHQITLKEWLQKEDFTLCLSVSLFGYWGHFGVLQALIENNLRPTRICGTSGGAIALTMYSYGFSIPEIIALSEKFEFFDMLTFRPKLNFTSLTSAFLKLTRTICI